jgi:small-conductance mechanosensitive channel
MAHFDLTWLQDIIGMENLFGYEIYGNTVLAYLVALIAFFVALSILRLFKYTVMRKLESLSKRTSSKIDDMIVDVIDTIGWPLYFFASLKVGLLFLDINDFLNISLNLLLILLGVIYAVRAVQKIIDFSVGRIDTRKKDEEVNKHVVDLIKKAAQGLMWIAAILFMLSSLGVDISAAVVGLGVGGIVIGFALQNILTDLFSAFSIYFDRPFEKGDFIIIGDDLGTVENIGLMSTRIKHLKGHELVVSNSELVKSRINNYKKMNKRRIVFSFGVTYDTPSSKLRKIPGIVKDIIDKSEHATLDRVHFREFGPSSLNYEVVYYVDTGTYNVYMDIQQEINLQIKERLEKLKVEFAFPTQTVYVKK